MKKRIGNKRRRPWLWLAVLVLLLAGCSSYTERVWLNAPGWRRAIQVGMTTIPDPVPPAVSADGTIYFMVVEQSGSGIHPTVIALNRQAQVLWEQAIDMKVTRPDQPRIVWDGTQLRLFWLDSGTLYTAEMDETGALTGQPRSISGELVAEAYDVALDQNGAVVVWFGGSRDEPGVYAFGAGSLQEEPLLIDEQGLEPHLEYDTQGNLHAVWSHYPPGASETNVYYANFSDGEVAADSATELTTIRVGITSVLDGPTFAVEDELGYLFWSIEVRTGPAAGTAETNYITFPLGAPQEATDAEQLYVPADYDLTYEDAGGEPLDAGARVPLANGQALQGGQAVPMQLETDTTYKAGADAHSGELVVAARSNVSYELRKQATQATLVYLDEGQPAGYQLLSFTRTGTMAPAVSRDDQGYLYATWLERAEETGFLVYLSSSAPDVREALSAIQAGDVAQMTVETIFGMLAGAALSPFTAILWMLAPLAVLGITGFLRRDNGTGISTGAIVSLVLALIIYWVAKSLTIPGLQEYVPFSAWIPIIPHWLEVPLRWGVPLVIGVAALLAAWHFTYRRNNQSVLYFMFIYAAVDSLLTMAVYGSIIYGFF